jgi:lipid II:glycine glycyltransferase (peptidoglycan interpeptide bridge formation enzyme)
MTRTIGNKFPNSFKRIFSLTMKSIKWRYGPVIFLQEHNLVLNNFLKYIINLKTKIDGSLHPFFKGNLDNFNLKKIKWSTYIIDLQNNRNNIIQNFDKKSVRNNIKRSQERGVEVKEINNDSIYEYSKLLNEYRLSINTSTYSERQVLELWRILTPVGFRGFIASKDGTNIAAITFSTFNGYINEWGIARSEKDTKEKLYAQDLLKWKIIEWGIANNQKYYDFSGFNPIPASKKEEGILRYKKKWGGKEYNFWILKR